MYKQYNVNISCNISTYLLINVSVVKERSLELIFFLRKERRNRFQYLSKK